MSRCGWGILGTGKIARIMACALRDSQAGWLVAVASRSAGRAAGFASQFGISRHYPDYASLIGDPDVDIVYVATHHPDHREWAVAAAEARKHVLCEKPLAVTADGAAEIIEAARRSGVFLMEAFAYRCHPQTSRLVETIRAGVIGKVRMVDASFGYDAGPEPGNYLLVHALGGGSILDVGCYATSMAHLIAAAGSGADIGWASNVCMQIRHSTGVPAAMTEPKFSVEPQCGQASCVLGMASSSLLSRRLRLRRRDTIFQRLVYQKSTCETPG